MRRLRNWHRVLHQNDGAKCNHRLMSWRCENVADALAQIFLPPLRCSRGLRSRVCAHCTHGCVPATTTWFYWLLLRFRGLCSRVCAHCTHGWVPCAPTGLNSCHHYVAKFVPPLRGSVCIDLSYRGLCSRLCTHCTHGCVPCAAMGLYLFLPVADGSDGKDADDGKNGE